MREREGWIIGRGVMDDKGPSVLCLYALKYLKDRGIPLRYPVRALLGANEETGMGDVEYYLANYKAPLFCFSPDANFPLCNGEKGITRGRMIAKVPLENIVDIRGGFVSNAIPDKAEARIRADARSTRSACWSSYPLNKLAGEQEERFLRAVLCLNENSDGSGLGVAGGRRPL